ncbi:MAG: hypothetical protein E5Y18_18305 [Mesorhizobium sp.]|nr:MAG: hypothetical protein E5Y18_18305 [Mesorhizobium sp.]
MTLAHGLSAKPKLITTALQCTTAEFDYSIGDEVAINVGSHDSPSGTNRGLSIVPDATKFAIRFGAAAAPLNVLNKTTGALSGITPASWKFVVRAWI